VPQIPYDGGPPPPHAKSIPEGHSKLQEETCPQEGEVDNGPEAREDPEGPEGPEGQEGQGEEVLALARADLIGAMNPAQVNKSEIRDRGATFHFVLDPNR